MLLGICGSVFSHSSVRVWSRTALRTPAAPSRNDPPLITCSSVPSYISEQNSATFPLMFFNPHGFAITAGGSCVFDGLLPRKITYLPITDVSCFPPKSPFFSNFAGSPGKKYGVVVPARQAYSHSASVGSR